MATTGKRVFEEFIVDTKQVSQIKQAKSKIERMHEVKITLKEVVKHESKQWIKVEGDVRDRMNARVIKLKSQITQDRLAHTIEIYLNAVAARPSIRGQGASTLQANCPHIWFESVTHGIMSGTVHLR